MELAFVPQDAPVPLEPELAGLLRFVQSGPGRRRRRAEIEGYLRERGLGPRGMAALVASLTDDGLVAPA
jgi:hypothetical protein